MNENDLTKTVMDPTIQARMLEQPLGETVSLPLEVLLTRLRELNPGLALDSAAQQSTCSDDERSKAIVRRSMWRAWGSQLRSSLELMRAHLRSEPWLRRGVLVLASVMVVHLALLARSTNGQTARGAPASLAMAPPQASSTATPGAQGDVASPPVVVSKATATPERAATPEVASAPETAASPETAGSQARGAASAPKARSLQRAAIDAAAEGRYAAALELYQELVRRYPTVAAYSEAQRILEARIELQP